MLKALLTLLIGIDFSLISSREAAIAAHPREFLNDKSQIRF